MSPASACRNPEWTLDKAIAEAFGWNNRVMIDWRSPLQNDDYAEYHDEAVDYRSKASPDALRRIEGRLDEAKSAFRAAKDACWYTPFYQMANRLSHLYYLAGINGKDAYMVFVDFAIAPDVPEPVSPEEWRGAVRWPISALA